MEILKLLNNDSIQFTSGNFIGLKIYFTRIIISIDYQNKKHFIYIIIKMVYKVLSSNKIHKFI
jgi:hypothetical protein